MQDVTDGISELVSENKFVNRLHRLCSTLIELCKPLINATAPAGRTTGTATPAERTTVPMEDGTTNMVIPEAGVHVDDFLTSSWQDDRMWQLFQSQPSLDWFNADILDPTWGDFGLPK